MLLRISCLEPVLLGSWHRDCVISVLRFFSTIEELPMLLRLLLSTAALISDDAIVAFLAAETLESYVIFCCLFLYYIFIWLSCIKLVIKSIEKAISYSFGPKSYSLSF